MLTRSRPRAASLVSAALLVAVTLAGCGGNDSGGSDTKSDASPEQVLATAKKTFDDTSGVSIALVTHDLPDGVTGIEKATGTGTHAPAFEGKIVVDLSGQAFEVPVVAVGAKVYAQLPLTTGFQDIDPTEYGAPDPAQLMAPDRGFSALLGSTSGLKKGKSVRGGADNKEILTEYTGTVGAQVMKGIIPTASGDFDVAYTITDDGELREADLTGVFYEKSSSMTYSVTFDDYGTTKDITAP